MDPCSCRKKPSHIVGRITRNKNMVYVIISWSTTARTLGMLHSKFNHLFIGRMLTSQSPPHKKRDLKWNVFVPDTCTDGVLIVLVCSVILDIQTRK